ncbi:MAG: crossover junction endodeoxyribonuclease RuvC [Anaerolineaceae bacterium]|jgi:crossover junction endodeoxyribonuclease RuvC|nr:crossover junction endodeoxyribonuclease RuvC [Anaerolineaceae bacterium]MDD4042072.1 crossover junction endodeoxyribonuclease RuvC [Anaerolineaceae bacterium]MDD4578103.1 crossover junction endodeoxyribonuclease RuvC [Anaerolineaceae bacterium]
MIVLGIDPGIAITGFGLIGLNQLNEPELITHGVINSTAEGDTSSRLIFLYRELTALIDQYKPEYSAVEKLFFQKNQKTAMAVSEARGVITLCLAQHHLPMAEYSPNAVKQAVTSYGNADKRQVQEMVKITLHLDDIPRPDDAADALAIAICHLGHLQMRRLMDEQ